ncbi:MAG: J domain-containing protein [Spirochaetota bacterium]|nr:J domain-containing protein [Spirochaetota bacterium]
MNGKSHKPVDDEIINAFLLLFDPIRKVSPNLISGLKQEEIKTAYRKKAFETHPDRAKSIGESESDMAERFKQVNLAYEKLYSFLENNLSSLNNINSSESDHNSNKSNSKRKKWASDPFYNGIIPNMELLIGQFIYYSGYISWGTLIQAIVWQRRQRPLFGQIAIDWNILSEEEIREILQVKTYKDKIGEYALRNDYISLFEYMAIMGKQRNLQRPIGEYFIQNGFVNSKNMESMVKRLQVHNRRVRLGE